jgi:hypothetical protein
VIQSGNELELVQEMASGGRAFLFSPPDIMVIWLIPSLHCLIPASVDHVGGFLFSE